MRRELLTTAESQVKIAKSLKKGVYTGILHLAPASISGFNMCPWSTPGCRAGCLNTAGRGAMSQPARLKKTLSFVEDRTAFLGDLYFNIKSIVTYARNHGLKPAVRLNGTSDQQWEAFPICIDGVDYPNLMAAFPNVQFYDYTKSAARVLWSLGRGSGAVRFPPNYHLTYSLSEDPRSRERALEVLRAGGNVAAVFRRAPLPKTWFGYPVVDATANDTRFLDPRPSIAGLVALGAAKRDTSGFVIDAAVDDEGNARMRHTGLRSYPLRRTTRRVR